MEYLVVVQGAKRSPVARMVADLVASEAEEAVRCFSRWVSPIYAEILNKSYFTRRLINCLFRTQVEWAEHVAKELVMRSSNRPTDHLSCIFVVQTRFVRRHLSQPPRNSFWL